MRKRSAWPLLQATMLLGACAPPPSSSAQVALNAPPPGEIEYRSLTDAELRVLLPGSYMREIVPDNLQDLSTPEQFNRDGTYIRYADNAELEGHYTVRDGKVCVKVDIHPGNCRFIAVDSAGRYFIGKSLLPADLKPVSRLPIGE